MLKVEIGRVDWYEDGIFITEDPSCEHCGELEPFEPIYGDTCTTWCLDCAENIIDLTVELREEALKKSYVPSAKYHLRQLNHNLLKIGLKELEVDFNGSLSN